MIGAGLTITGNLESKGEVQVEGEVQGDVHAQYIVIGERARITGALIAEEIVVRGNVQGSIRGAGHAGELRSGPPERWID